MFVSNDYCKILDTCSKQLCKTPNDYGSSLEFEVNRQILNMDEFVLYWDVNIFVKKDMKWVLCGDFFTADNPDNLMEISKKKQIDHVLITPEVVFIFESKYYDARYTYTRGNGKFYRSNDELPDPSVQSGLYGAIFRQVLRYYEVDLPVVTAGVFKHELKIKNGTMGDDLIVLDNVLDFIIKHTNAHPRKPQEAIKLCKSLFFDKCRPIAYDGNISKW